MEGIFQYRCLTLLNSAEKITFRYSKMICWKLCHSVWWFSHHFPVPVKLSFVHFPACHDWWPKGIFQSSDCELTMSIHKIRCFFFKSLTADVWRCTRRFRKSGTQISLVSNLLVWLNVLFSINAVMIHMFFHKLGSLTEPPAIFWDHRITCMRYEQSGPDANSLR